MLKFSLATVALAFFCGCATSASEDPSDKQRARSFGLFDSQKAKELGRRIEDRTAILLSGSHLSGAKVEGNSVTVQIASGPKLTDEVLESGMAAAIEKDGYFLTAAHLVEKPALNLIFWDGEQAHVQEARVVARLSNSKERIDLAVVHVEGPIGDVFNFAEESALKKGRMVAGIGLSEKVFVGMEGLAAVMFFAGTITKTKALTNDVTLIVTKLPTRNGDSGGPLVSSEGALVGIHSATGTYWWGGKRAAANCPSKNWLMAVIAEDRKKNHEANRPVPMVLRKADDKPRVTIKWRR